MLFSIVIPVYNVADYLQDCVESVLANDCRDCEIILVDDGATDGICPQLCDRFAQEHPQLIHVIHQENRGLGGARNSAIEVAQGEYLLFLDSDDTITPDCLTVLRGAIERHHADIIAFHLAPYSETGEALPGVPSHSLPTDRPVSLKEYPGMLMDPPATCSRLWRRSLFLDSGIRFPSRLWYEDLHTTAKMLLQAKTVVGLDAHIYRYLIRSGSIMNNANVSRNGEIMTGLDAVMDWYREQSSFSAYESEFCGLTLHHICYSISRVVRQNHRHPLLKELGAYLTKQFPDYKHCPYYESLSSRQRLILQLVLRGHCGVAAGVFKLNDMLHRR